LLLEVELPGPHASIWRFRQMIKKLGLSAALLSETNRQLDALGLIVSAVRWLTRRWSPRRSNIQPMERENAPNPT
jgi:hypothetical protein